MQVKRCDVVGCGQLAYWLRVTPARNGHEARLCQNCWSKLHTHSPDDARCYAPADDPEGAEFAFSSGTRSVLQWNAMDEESDFIG